MTSSCKRLVRGVFALLLSSCGLMPANGATTVNFQISFVPPDEPVAAVQLDIAIPSSARLTSVTPGAALIAAGKDIFTSDLQPGAKRVLIAGLNPNAIGAGVIATVSMGLDSATATAGASITITNVTASDPSGNTVSFAPGTGQGFAAVQTGGCMMASAGSLVLDATAQTISFGNCLGLTASNADWMALTMTSGGQLTGAIAANLTGAERSGIATMGGISISVTQRATVAVFADVPPARDFFDAIDFMYTHSITSGCSSAPPAYCPDLNLTRFEMAVFMIRAVMGGDSFAYTGTPYFVDVPASHPYFKWIQKMKDLGITNGCTADHYCPDSLVTRGQMAAFIIRARYGASVPYNYPAAAYFADVPQGDGFYAPIQKMKQVGITSGCQAAAYCPDSPVTRGQVAVFVMRGEFNLLLPANTPTLVSMTPATVPPGQMANVMINGRNTNFVNGITQFTAGPGVTVSSVLVTGPNTATVQITAAPDATLGPRTIVALTGAEEAAIPNGFRVQ